ncbi:MAG TPA: hypothetical protein DEF42_09615 [Desulfosporosinus sp.]|nr:hypothetical protein [Desulfosporosinus sp.]
MSKQTQAFNDGVVSIYKVGNISPSGNMPKEGLTFKVGPLRYEERIVGMGRFWSAMQAKARIDMVLRVPQLRGVSSQDIAIPNDGKQYEIKQIQYPPDVDPPVMDLSLERVDAVYDIA